MKKILMTVMAVALMAVAGKAQTNFFQSALGYFTSNSTNFTWVGNKLEFAIGAEYQNNLEWANDLEIQYNLTDKWGAAWRMKNAGIAGTVVAQEVKLSYALVNVHAIKVEASLYGGYDLQYQCAVAEPQLGIRKKLTDNTFAGIAIGEPILFTRNASQRNQWVPNIVLETGFTF